jgi:spore coat protein U-like protein
MKSMKQRLTALLGAAALAAMMNSAIGATTSANLGVSASVAATCSIGATITTVAFGPYDPVVANASTPLNGTGSFDVTCTSGASGTSIGLDSGLNASGGIRRMTNGTSFLNYYLYQDSARTTAWGNTIGTDTVTPAAWTGAAQTFTVYGQIPAGQPATSGSYADTVTITVTY